MTDIVMPRLSDTMEEGTILRWLKRDGDQVNRGEELVEIETDKASMTYESDQQGVLQIVAREGDTLAIGEVIAHVGDSSATPIAPATVGAAAEVPEVPVTPPPAPAPVGAPPLSQGDGAAAEPQPAAPAAGQQSPGARLKVSPLARRIAQEREVPLDQISGSGPGGRIVKADVEAAERGAMAPAPIPPPAAPAPAPPAPPAPTAAAPVAPPTGEASPPAGTPAPEVVTTAKGDTVVHELTRTQQLIARRMAESKATIPHFALETEIDMEECVALRAELARHLQASTVGEPAGTDPAGPAASQAARAPSYNDMIVKACAIALREHPRVNGSYRDARMQLHGRVNVGVAVAVDSDDPLRSALVVPTVFDADIKSLGEIARESRALAERVRNGTITPPELSGGTFTVSNLGMYGVRSFSAIINPPQAAILSVGALERRPVVRGEAVVPGSSMAVTLACDHRILYGADAARFLGRVRELLEAPSALLL